MMALTNQELVRMVDNNPNASELERELAQRVDELMIEIKLISEDNAWTPSDGRL